MNTTPATDCIGIGAIAQAPSEDPTLQMVRLGSQRQHRQIFNVSTHSSTTHSDRKWYTSQRWKDHPSAKVPRKGYPNCTKRSPSRTGGGLKRRLRYHFFFHGMDNKVEKFVKSCNDCNVFVDKKTKEPIKPHRVSERCWETVTVDIFGPMPSSKHVVVVQDLAWRYPAAKMVTSTKAEKVIPVLKQIYETYGNPSIQILDNGPPFNSIQMQNLPKLKTRSYRKHYLYTPNGTQSKPSCDLWARLWKPDVLAVCQKTKAWRMSWETTDRHLIRKPAYHPQLWFFARDNA